MHQMAGSQTLLAEQFVRFMLGLASKSQNVHRLALRTCRTPYNHMFGGGYGQFRVRTSGTWVCEKIDES